MGILSHLQLTITWEAFGEGITPIDLGPPVVEEIERTIGKKRKHTATAAKGGHTHPKVSESLSIT